MEDPKSEGLRKIQSQHERLSELVARLVGDSKEATGPNGGVARVRTLSALNELEKLLQEHFAREEEGGYLSEALALAPRLSRRAEVLESEHRELTEAVRGLVAQVEGAGGSHERWVDVGRGVESFGDAIGRHELAENDLVRSALMDDLGGGA